MTLSTEIKQAREKLGFTQEQAAKDWGIPLGTLKGYEKGQRQPRGLAMTKLREILSSVAAKPASPSSASPEAPGTPQPPKQKRRRLPKRKPPARSRKARA